MDEKKEITFIEYQKENPEKFKEIVLASYQKAGTSQKDMVNPEDINISTRNMGKSGDNAIAFRMDNTVEQKLTLKDIEFFLEKIASFMTNVKGHIQIDANELETISKNLNNRNATNSLSHLNEDTKKRQTVKKEGNLH